MRTRQGHTPIGCQTVLVSRNAVIGARPGSSVQSGSAADNLKRVRRPAAEDWTESPGLSRLTQYLELKTVWHPIGV